MRNHCVAAAMLCYRYTGGVNSMNILIEYLFSFFSNTCPLIFIYYKDLIYRLSTSGKVNRTSYP